MYFKNQLRKTGKKEGEWDDILFVRTKIKKIAYAYACMDIITSCLFSCVIDFRLRKICSDRHAATAKTQINRASQIV